MKLKKLFLIDVGTIVIDPLSSAVMRRASSSKCPHGNADHLVVESLNEKHFFTCYTADKDFVVCGCKP